MTRRCQSNAIERKSQSNQSSAIERERTIAIRLSNAIESRLNSQFLGNIRLRSIGVLCSIAFDWLSTFDWFDWLNWLVRLIERSPNQSNVIESIELKFAVIFDWFDYIRQSQILGNIRLSFNRPLGDRTTILIWRSLHGFFSVDFYGYDGISLK